MNKKEKWERGLCADGYPFERDGMSLKEFQEEHIYYLKNIENVRNGTYKPLWKQREEKQ